MVRIENLKDVIIGIREQSVLLDSNVARLYGVETKRINEAVKNNPDNDDLQTSDAETSIELNFAVLKFRHTVKKIHKK